MSSYVYPGSLAGQTPDVIRSPQWDTEVQEACSGKQTAIGHRLYPLTHFELAYEFLSDVSASASDVKALVGLFNALRGPYDTFLFTDPIFNQVLPAGAQPFGTGDGSTLVFQLQAIFGNAGGTFYPEIIQALNGTPILYDNGSTISSSNYSINSAGVVTFGAGHAPASGHALTWSGSFYYRCAFDDDEMDLEKFLNQLWRSKRVRFTQVKL